MLNRITSPPSAILTRPSTHTTTPAHPSRMTPSSKAKATPSQSTPVRSPPTDVPSSVSGDTSYDSSSGGGDSIVYRASSGENDSGSSLDSSFGALRIGAGSLASTDSSFEIVAHASPSSETKHAVKISAESSPAGRSSASKPPVHDKSGAGGGSREKRHSRHSSLAAIDEKKELGLLNPAAKEFDPVEPLTCGDYSTTFEAFEQVVSHGKDAWGQLTLEAKEALAQFGLKPIPSLHGPLNLPYARCASGIDAFPDDPDLHEDIWKDEVDGEGNARPQRTLPIPLPGNARYTQAGRLAMRYALAPARLGTSASLHVAKKPSPPFGRRSQAFQPEPRAPARDHGNNPRTRRNDAPHLGPPPTRERSTTPRSSQPTMVEPQSRVPHVESDVERLAQAQAAYHFYLQQAQLAHAFGGQASAAEHVATQATAAATVAAQRAGLAAAASAAVLPPSPPFASASKTHVSLDGLVYTSMLAPAASTDLPGTRGNDPLALAKIAGERPLRGKQQAEGSALRDHPVDTLAGRDSAADVASTRASVDRSRHEAGLALDSLRRSASHDRRGESRRNSSATTHHDSTSSLARPPQVVRRRRSAAPAMPYPGHSLRKASTSSIVTVNSTAPRPVAVPEVRIFADSDAPLAIPSSCRGSVSSGRAFADVANALGHAPTGSLSKTVRPSAAEASSNWRRPSISSHEELAIANTSGGTDDSWARVKHVADILASLGSESVAGHEPTSTGHRARRGLSSERPASVASQQVGRGGGRKKGKGRGGISHSRSNTHA
ncbi:hypothetical protein JCM10212_002895 [Sporobolomyces blumeae]